MPKISFVIKLVHVKWQVMSNNCSSRIMKQPICGWVFLSIIMIALLCKKQTCSVSVNGRQWDFSHLESPVFLPFAGSKVGKNLPIHFLFFPEIIDSYKNTSFLCLWPIGFTLILLGRIGHAYCLMFLCYR